jgi:hypothetical protein
MTSFGWCAQVEEGAAEAEAALTRGARLQALIVEVAHMALVHATCAATELAARLTGGCIEKPRSYWLINTTLQS